MERIRGVVRDYAWGSPEAIPGFLGQEPPGGPVAEYWLGAHPDAPALIGGNAAVAPDGFANGAESPGRADLARDAGLARSETGGANAHGPGEAADLRARIAAAPTACLGGDVVARFGAQLPYLLKLIAPAQPLSLQVHPSLERARRRFAEEEAAGVPPEARSYRDPNHKPELVYALTTFRAMCGFRAPRRAAELLAGLDAPLAVDLHTILRAEPSPAGIREVFTTLLSPATRPSPREVHQVAEACAARLEAGSPSPRVDSTVVALAEAHPGDPGVVVSLLLNPVTLRPGEVFFVPAGGVHVYLSGLGVELMASSDNVLRAGLTRKQTDIPEMLDCVEYLAAPPIRLAPEVYHGATRVFYAPVDDFELAITTCDDDGVPQPLPSRGPRILLGLDGEVQLATARETALLRRGEAVFVRADEGALTARGQGRIAQAAVP